jgi:hypothetical protein
VSQQSIGWFFVVLSALMAFSAAWSLKTGWASKHYPTGRDHNRNRHPVRYWLIVGGNGFVAVALLGFALVLFAYPAPGR